MPPSFSYPITIVAEHWSVEEVAATVTDYFDMLERELRGEPFSKRAHTLSGCQFPQQ